MEDGKHAMVTIRIGDNGPTVVTADPESFDTEDEMVLTEASIETVGERLVVTGNERAFDIHWDRDDGWYSDLSGKISEYVIGPDDFHTPPAPFLHRCIGIKPVKRLKTGWYMRLVGKPVRVEIGGNYVLVDPSVADRA